MLVGYEGKLLVDDIKHGISIYVPRKTEDGIVHDIYPIEKIDHRYWLGEFNARSPRALLKLVSEGVKTDDKDEQ